MKLETRKRGVRTRRVKGDDCKSSEDVQPAREAVREWLEQTDEQGQRLCDRLRDDAYPLLVEKLATDCLSAEDRVGTIDQLVIEAEHDRAAYDALNCLAKWLDGLGESLPPVLQSFVVGAERPTKRGRPLYENLARDYVIPELVLAACRTVPSLRPTRNDEPREPKISACDIVVDSLKEIAGMRLSYDHVKRIWQRHRGWQKTLSNRRSQK